MNFPFLVKENDPLSSYCYMKVGGPADFTTIAKTTDELVNIIIFANENKIPYFILGSGSNTIFTDKGFRGLVVLNHTSKLEINAPLLITDSGIPTNVVVNQANNVGLGGLEEFLGIPGTIGGALYNNSHYLKSLIGDHVSRVELLKNNQRVWVAVADLDLAYDYSILQKTHETILKIEFTLSPEEPQKLKTIATQCLQKRRDTQPLELPSSGCMFQNPPGKSAGALIDSIGLKGRKIGGAEISTVHANFIVNRGGATTKDIIDLSNQIIESVQDKYQLTLKREVFIVNEYGERINT